MDDARLLASPDASLPAAFDDPRGLRRLTDLALASAMTALIATTVFLAIVFLLPFGRVPLFPGAIAAVFVLPILLAWIRVLRRRSLRTALGASIAFALASANVPILAIFALLDHLHRMDDVKDALHVGTLEAAPYLATMFAVAWLAIGLPTRLAVAAAARDLPSSERAERTSAIVALVTTSIVLVLAIPLAGGGGGAMMHVDQFVAFAFAFVATASSVAALVVVSWRRRTRKRMLAMITSGQAPGYRIDRGGRGESDRLVRVQMSDAIYRGVDAETKIAELMTGGELRRAVTR